jgi:hypothetical protein
MPDSPLRIRKELEKGKSVNDQQKSAGDNFHKRLIGLGPPEKPPVSQSSFTESDMTRMRAADKGNDPRSVSQLLGMAESIAQKKVNAQLQGVSDKIRNRPVESIPTGKGFVTREEQKVRDMSQELVDQYRMHKNKSEREARNAQFTPESAYVQYGHSGNQFEN